MNVTTVGIKATVSCTNSRSGIGAGASLTISNGVVSSVVSETALNTLIETLQSDDSTWDEVEEVGGAKVQQNANDDPVIFTGLAFGTKWRIRNSSAGAVTMSVTYWELV